MKLGCLVVVMMLGGGAAGLGCSHEAKPVIQPDEHPPLPPASGTVVGQLVDHAHDLKLSDAQVTRLREISDTLAAQLATDDSGLRADQPGAAPLEEDGRGVGFHAGGMNGDGQYGGGQVFPNAGKIDPPGTTRSFALPAQEARATHTRDAIRRAFGVLDANQQTGAKQILAEHGVDPDTGRELGDAPGTKALEDPKLGQPLPRAQ